MDSQHSPKDMPPELAQELLGTPAANALPINWMRALFVRLGVRYGAPWHAKWAHIPDIGMVHQDWANKLGGFTGGAIAYALNHLPNDPPNVEEFKKICRNHRDENSNLLLKEHFKKTPEADALFKKTMAEVQRRLRATNPQEGGK